MNLKYLGPLAFMLLLTSCLVQRIKTADVQYITKTPIYQKPLVADIEVEIRKISGSLVVKKKEVGSDLQAAKSLAVAETIKKNNCDVLIQPMYDIEITSSSFTITVSGYPGKYTEFRPLTPADSSLFIANNYASASKQQQVTIVTGEDVFVGKKKASKLKK